MGAQNVQSALGQVSQRQGRMDEARVEMSAGIQFFSPGLPEDTGAIVALWSPRGQAACTSPAFPEFARKVGFAALWDQYGPPDLCQKDASGDYRCK